MYVDRWHTVFDVSEGNRLVLMHQVADEESGPGITRLRIGNDKDVVWEDCQSPSRNDSARGDDAQGFHVVGYSALQTPHSRAFTYLDSSRVTALLAGKLFLPYVVLWSKLAARFRMQISRVL